MFVCLQPDGTKPLPEHKVFHMIPISQEIGHFIIDIGLRIHIQNCTQTSQG